VNSSSESIFCAERGTTHGEMVSYILGKSRESCEGTAIRCVSMYSESRTIRFGGTIDVRDLLERLPLGKG